jgi:hypothetical protein
LGWFELLNILFYYYWGKNTLLGYLIVFDDYKNTLLVDYVFTLNFAKNGLDLTSYYWLVKKGFNFIYGTINST